MGRYNKLLKTGIALLSLLLFVANSNVYGQTNQDVACDHAILDATGTGLWTTSTTGVTITNPTNPTSDVTGLNVGANTLIWTPTTGAPSTITITRHEANAGSDMPDNATCSSASLSATNPSPLTGTWTNGGAALTYSPNINDPNATVSGIPPMTTKTLRWTISGGPAGCEDYDEINIRNNTPTGVSVAGNGTTVCNNNQINLQGSAVPTGGYVGAWTYSGPGTPTFVNINSNETLVTGLEKGTYTFTWTITHTASGCSASASATITNNTVVAQASDITTCDAVASLNATLQSGETGSWSFIGAAGTANITDPTNPVSTITGLEPNVTYTLNWHVEQGASCSDDIQITVIRSPNSVSAVAVGGIDRKCADDAVAGDPNPTNRNATFDLHGDLPAGATGLWTYVAGPQAPTFTNPNNSNITVEVVPGAHTFRWTVTGGAGTCANAYGEVTIYNDQPTTAYAGPDKTICSERTNDLIGLTASQPAPGETGTWSSSNPSLIFGNPNAHLTNVRPLPQGYNTLTWTVSKAGCTSRDEVVVEYRKMPATITAGSDPFGVGNLCSDTYSFSGATNPQTISPTAIGTWTVLTGFGTFDNDTEYNTTVRNMGLGRNEYLWTITDGGCSVSADVRVRNFSVKASAGVDDYTCNGSYNLNGHITSGATINVGDPAGTILVATGTWTGVSGSPATFLPNNTTEDAVVTNLSDNNNQLIWTVSNGQCTDVDVVNISNDTIRNVSAGRDTIFCGIDFNSYQELFQGLQGSTPQYSRGETGIWSIEAGSATFLEASTLTNPKITDLQHYVRNDGDNPWDSHPTINTFRWTVTYKNCQAYDEVDIINAAPYAANAGPDQDVCLDEGHLNALDHGSGAYFHQWSVVAPTPPPPSIAISNPALYNSYVQGLQSSVTTFRWTKRNEFGPGAAHQVYQHPDLAITCEVWDETEMNSLMMAGQRPNAGEEKYVCATFDRMTATSPETSFGALTPPESVKGRWSIDQGSGNFANATFNSTMVTSLGYGRNIFRWTVTYDNGQPGTANRKCIATDVVGVVNALPSNANINTHTDRVCDASVDVGADRPIIGEGYWSAVPSSIVFSDATCQDYDCTVTVDNLQKGSNNTVRWTVVNTYVDPNNGKTKTCELYDEMTIYERSIIATVTPHPPVCDDQVTAIGSVLKPDETGVWVNSAGGVSVVIHSPSNNQTLITGLGQNENTFYWRITNGDCDAEALFTVVNNNPQDPNIAQAPEQVICKDWIELNGNPITTGRGVGHWEVGSYGTGTFTSPSSNVTRVNGLSSGQNEFKWVVEKGDCREEANVMVYNNSVTANAGADIPRVCGFETQTPRSQVTLTATPPNPIEGESGVWTRAVGDASIQIHSASSNQTLVTDMGRGVNTFRWTLYSKVQNGVQCHAEDLIDVHVFIPDSADAGNDKSTCTSPTETFVLKGASVANNGIGTWRVFSQSGSGGGTILNEHSNETGVTSLGRDRITFEWAIKAHPDCPASVDYVTVTNNYVEVDPMPNRTTCDGTIQLQGTNPTNFYAGPGHVQPTGEWTVHQGTATFTPATDISLYDATISGLSNTVTNQLRWRITKGGCNDEEFVEIENKAFAVVAGNDQVVCDNFATLDGSQPQSGTGQAGHWELGGTGTGTFDNSTAYNTIVRGLTPNAWNEFRWTVDNGICAPNDVVRIYYNYVTSDAGLGDNVCSDTYTLKAVEPTDGATGVWTQNAYGKPNASISNATLYNTVVTDISQGNTTFIWTVTRNFDAGGGISRLCTATSSVDIWNDTPSPALVEPDKSFCSNSGQVQVQVSPLIGVGEWSDNKGVTYLGDKTNDIVNVTALPLGETIFTWTVTNKGCTSSADLRVTNDAVVADAGTAQSTNCTDAVSLLANNPALTQGSGTWHDLDNTTAIFGSSANYLTTVTNLRTGTTRFQWTVTKNKVYGGGAPCTASDIVVITNNQIDAGIDFNLESCNDTYAALPGQDVSPYGTGYWESVGNTAIIANSTLYNSSVTGLDPGSNTLIWHVTSNAEGCTDQANVVINNLAVTASVMNDFETCNDQANLVASDPGSNTAYWTQTAGNPATIYNSTSYNTAYVTGLTQGSYTFTWHVESAYASCTDATDDVTITNNRPVAMQPTAVNSDICDGNASLQATLQADETGVWSVKPGSGGIIVSPTNITTSVTDIPIGTHTYIWTVQRGASNVCSDSKEISITNHQVEANVITPLTTNCTSTANLVAVVPVQGIGLWSDDDGTLATIVNSNSAITSVTGVVQGTTHFRWTVRKQRGSNPDFCEASAVAEVINNQVTAALNGSATVDHCGSTYTLSANSAILGGRATGEWSQVPSAGPIVIVEPSNPNTQIQNITTGIQHTLRWTVTSNDEGCTDFTDFKITNKSVNASVTKHEIYVCGNTGELSAVDPAPNNGTWSIDYDPTSSLTLTHIVGSSYLATVTGIQDGQTYKFKWTVNSTSSCSDVDDWATITNNKPVNVTAGADPHTCDGSASLTSGRPLEIGETGLWTKDPAKMGTIIGETLENATVTGMSLGNNTFTWTITKGAGTDAVCSVPTNVIVRNDEVHANAGQDRTTACVDYVTLDAVPPLQGTGTWVTSAGGSVDIKTANSYNTFVSDLIKGNNEFTWTVTHNSCSDSDEVIITNNLPTDANAGPDQSTCNSTVTLAANIPAEGVGHWEKENMTSTIHNSLANNTDVTVLSGSSNKFIWLIEKGGCVSRDTVEVTNNSYSVTATANVSSVCDGRATITGTNPALVGTGTGIGEWTVIHGSADALGTNSSLFSVNVSGLSTINDRRTIFKWTIDDDCDADATVTIYNNQVFANVSNDSVFTCENYANIMADDPALQAGGVTGHWEFLDVPVGSTPSIDNANSFSTIVRNLAANKVTSLRWVVELGSCNDVDTVKVWHYVPNAHILTGDLAHGCSDVITLTAEDIASGATGVWATTSSDPAIDIQSPNNSSTVVTGLPIDNTKFTWTVNHNGCTSKDEVIINNSKPLNTIGTAYVAACSNTFTMDAQEPQSGESGLWTTISGIVVSYNSTLNNTEVVIEPGLVQLKWTITEPGGCSTDKLFTIENQNPKFVNAGIDRTVCENDVELSATELQPGERGVWTIPALPDNGAALLGAGSTLHNPNVTIPPGVTTFQWTVWNSAGACPKSDYVSITNIAPDTYAGTDRSICGTEVTLSATPLAGGQTGYWTCNNPAVKIIDSNNNVTEVQNLPGGGATTFTWTVQSASCPDVSDEVKITGISKEVTAGPSYSACADSIGLVATPPDADWNTGYWEIITSSGGVGEIIIGNSTSNNTYAKNLGDVTEFRWTLVNTADPTCKSSAERTFWSLLPSEPQILNGELVRLCKDSLLLSATPPDPVSGETGRWERIEGGSQTTIEHSNLAETWVKRLSIGETVLTWTISNNDCFLTDTITIRNDQVFADAGDDIITCDTIIPTIQSPSPDSRYSGVWTSDRPEVTFGNSLYYITSVEHLQFGENRIIWTVTSNDNPACTDVDDMTITNNLPRNVSAGNDRTVCGTTVQLAATPAPTNGTGKWRRLIQGATPTPDDVPTPMVNDLELGSNMFEWTVTVGDCSVSDTVEITNNQIPISAGAQEQNICNTDFLQLLGATQPGPGQTGAWHIQSGGGATTAFDNSNVYNTTIRDLEKGTTVIKWVITDPSPGGCSGEAYVAINNNTPSDAVLIGAYPAVLCEDSMQLLAQAPLEGVGRWRVTNGGGEIENSLSPVTWVKNIPYRDNNQFTWTVDKNGCKKEAVITVDNQTMPNQISQPVLTICEPTHTVTISASELIDGRTGLWTPADPSINIANPNANTTIVSNLKYGSNVLKWEVTSTGGCTREDELEIVDNYMNSIMANTSSPSPLCQDYASIQGTSLPVGTYGYWTATSNDAVFDNSNSYSTVVRQLPRGKCDLVWTIVKNGCESKSAKLPLHNRSFTAYAGQDDVTCTGEYTLRAPALESGQTGTWTVDNAQATFNDPVANPVNNVSNLLVGTNTFTWTVSDAYCSASADVVISNNVFTVTAGVDRTNCGPSTTLKGSDPLSGIGRWTKEGASGAVFVNRSHYETVVNDMDNGDNTFRWTVNRNGCEASATVTINNIRYEAVVDDDREVCGERATVTANMYEGVPGLEGRWEVVSGPGYFGADSTNTIAVARGLQKGENKLSWTLGIAGESCKHSDYITVTNIASASRVANTEIPTCEDNVEIMATPLGEGETGYWTAGGQGVRIDNASLVRTRVRDLLQGNNIFTWTAMNGECKTESQVLVISNHFVPNAGPDQLLKVDTAVMQAELPGLPGEATGRWIPVGGFGNISTVDLTNPQALVNNLQQGVNTFRWEVTWKSCISSDDVDIIYNTIDANAGNDTVICGERMYLNAEDPYPARGRWEVINGVGKIVEGQEDNPKAEVVNLKPGSVTQFKWIVTINGYTTYDELVVSNGEFQIEAGQDREYCENSAILAAEPAGSNGSGKWTVIQGEGKFDDPSMADTRVTELAPGPNVLEWTVTKNTGCVSSDRIVVTYNVPPVANFATDVEEGCSPLTVHYENRSVNGVKYFWNFGEDQREDTAMVNFDRDYIAYDTDSVYTTRLIVVSDKNCSDTVIHQFTVFGIPKVKFEAYPAYQIYPDATINIDNYSDEGYTNYYWTYGDGNTKVDVQRETGFSHTYDTWGEYEITLAVNSGKCNDTVSQKILIVAPEPTNKGGRSYADCAPVEVDFNANTLYSDTAYWVINKLGEPLNVGDTLKGHKLSFIFDEPGTYYANLWATGPGMENGAMKYMRTDTIVVYPVPVASFIVSPDTVMLPNQAVHCYNRSIDGYTYSWDFGDSTDIVKEENPQHYYLKEGKYNIRLKVWSENKCYDDTLLSRPIVVEPSGLCVFPNAFTPSKAGPTGGRYSPDDVSNDVFHPVYRGVKEYKLEIFNRWGAKIFESNDPAIGWDGYVNGRLVQQDVYVWKVTGKYKNGVNFKKTGDCTLLK